MLRKWIDIMKKVVLITGSSRGLGRDLAICFAKDGYNVVINYCNCRDLAVSLAKKLEDEFKIKSLVVKCDVSIEDEVKEMVDKVISEFGRLDVVINNAGISDDCLLEEKSSDRFRRVLDVNLVGTFLVSKYASLVMGEGSIINISSTNGIDTYYPYSMDYDASKAGVISLTHNFANLLAPKIRVNAIAAGWMNTSMNGNMDKELVLEEEARILLGRFADPVEVARVALFLASDDASYINDSVIRVDGGVKNV